MVKQHGNSKTKPCRLFVDLLDSFNPSALRKMNFIQSKIFPSELGNEKPIDFLMSLWIFLMK